MMLADLAFLRQYHSNMACVETRLAKPSEQGDGRLRNMSRRGRRSFGQEVILSQPFAEPLSMK